MTMCIPRTTITLTHEKKRIVNKNESLKVSELIIIIIGDSKGQYQTTIER